MQADHNFAACRYIMHGDTECSSLCHDEAVSNSPAVHHWNGGNKSLRHISSSPTLCCKKSSTNWVPSSFTASSQHLSSAQCLTPVVSEVVLRASTAVCQHSGGAAVPNQQMLAKNGNFSPLLKKGCQVNCYSEVCYVCALHAVLE